MDCQPFFHDYLNRCPESIKVNILDSVPDGPYSDLRWLITDKFGHEYAGDVVTDGLGGFEIPVADLPQGLLTHYAGNFTLKVLDVNRECRPVPIMVAGYYEAIEFHIRRGDAVKDYLGCLPPTP